MIELINVNKIYKSGKTSFQALKDVSLKFEQGEMVAILGKSGSGKTTLLNIIGLLDSYDSGKCYLLGNDVGEWSENEKANHRNKDIGIVLQDYSLINHKKVLFNVMLPLFFDKKEKFANMKNKAIEALKRVGIYEQKNKKVINLSGGQKQRVAIARALVNNPKIILADEPTGALDTGTADEIMGLLKELNQKGITIIIVTHDLEIASRCKRIIEIKDGCVVRDEINEKN